MFRSTNTTSIVLLLVFALAQSCSKKNKTTPSTTEKKVASTESTTITDAAISAAKPLANINSKSLLSEYAKPYPVSYHSTEDTDRVYQQAIKAYQLGEWEEAFNLFFKMNPKTDQIMLYEASCKMQLESYFHAEQIINSLLPLARGQTKEHAEWYLALAYLGEKRKRRSIAQLKLIQAKPTHLFSEQAGELLLKISG